MMRHCALDMLALACVVVMATAGVWGYFMFKGIVG